MAHKDIPQPHLSLASENSLLLINKCRFLSFTHTHIHTYIHTYIYIYIYIYIEREREREREREGGREGEQWQPSLHALFNHA